MKLGWVLGWAVPETWFRQRLSETFPAAKHICVEAGPDALAELEAAGSFDWIGGYSLGSLVLLRDPARANRLGPVVLLAPIFAFPRECALGGRVARAQLRHLARWLRREPEAALADFYRRAGLDVPVADAPVGDLDFLLWGLDELETAAVSPSLPAGWRAWCGADDALLDATRLQALAPSVRIVPGATHHPALLLRSFAEETRWEETR